MVRNPFRKEEPTTTTTKTATEQPQVIEQEINLTLLNSKLNHIINEVDTIKAILQGVAETPEEKPQA